MSTTIILGDLTLRADTEGCTGLYPVTFISSTGNRIGSLYIGEQEWSRLCTSAADAERHREALLKISAIRDSIVGMQGFNFSEHAYPLVAVLDAAGFPGAGYEISRANLGTLIEQRDAAEAARDAATRELADQRAENTRLMSLLGEAMNPPPGDYRAEVIAAHLWLTQHCIPTRKDDGTQMTLAERVRFVAEDRSGAQSVAIDNLAARLQIVAADLSHLQPLASLVGDWDWTQMDRHDLARDERLAEQICAAFRAVEAAWKKAKEADRG